MKSEPRDITPIERARVDRQRREDAPLTDAERDLIRWLVAKAYQQWKNE